MSIRIQDQDDFKDQDVMITNKTLPPSRRNYGQNFVKHSQTFTIAIILKKQ